MKRISPVILIVVTGFFCMANAPEKIDMGDFSATVTKYVADNTFTGKMYISRDKIRDENNYQGKKSVTIIRLDKKLSWVLMANNQYMEISSKEQKDILPLEKQAAGPKYEIKSLGKETVNGYPCEVKQYTCKEEDCGITTQWYSPKLKYMVRTEHKDTKNGTVTFKQEITDIKQGKIDAALFEVPPGYVKFDPMSQVPAGMQDMMKGMMKGMMKDGMPKSAGN